jgi:hypothetical protein
VSEALLANGLVHAFPRGAQVALLLARGHAQRLSACSFLADAGASLSLY